MASSSSSIGYGAMGLSAFYGSSASTGEEDKLSVLKHAAATGAPIINSATFYGPLNVEGYGHNLRLLRKAIEGGLNLRRCQLMVKVGMDTRAPMDKTGQQWNVLGDRDSLRADVDYTLKELGVPCLDIAVLCRVPPTGIETAVTALKEMQAEGKIKKIGVSEASADNIRKAHAICPLYCIEQEWSLWARDVETDIVPTCKELGIKFIAYSPLGRGFLTGALRDRSDPAFSAHDFRLHMYPRMSESNWATNLALVDAIKVVCERKGCTQNQLALAWLLAQGKALGLDVIPIPGTSKIEHLDSNMAASALTLSAEDMAEIEAVFPKDIDAKVGTRYAHMNMCFNAQVEGGAAAGAH